MSLFLKEYFRTTIGSETKTNIHLAHILLTFPGFLHLMRLFIVILLDLLVFYCLYWVKTGLCNDAVTCYFDDFL